MQLTIREAATLTGRSARTLRAQVARGDLSGVKRNGQWYIDRRQLPLTDAQRRSLQAKAESLRKVVDGGLPSRLARAYGQRARSLADLDAFRLGASLLAEIRSAAASTISAQVHEEVIELLERSLLAVAEAAHQYDRGLKLEALSRARAAMARVAGRLLVAHGLDAGEPVATWLATLEGEVLPAVAGYARWIDRLGRSRP